MSRKDNIDKRMRKIERSEEKALKILSKQKKELLKALDENEKLIGSRLSKGTPAELKLEAEIEKLTQRLESMQAQMTEIKIRREEQIQPLRQRSSELRDKLKLVENQIESSQSLRDRTGCGSSNMLAGSRLDLDVAGFDNASSDPSGGGGDFSSSSAPPAYSPYWKD